MPAVSRALRTHPEALLLVGLLAVQSLRWNYVVDDAFISFRYARNLVEGRGLVYNVGERVEGYTNFLWVLLLSLGSALRADPVIVSKLVGLAAAAALVACLAIDVARRLGRPVGFAAGLVLAADPSFALWAAAGLETPLFLLLAYFALRPLVGEAPRLPAVTGLWAGLATLTRPEGALVFAALLAASLVVRAEGSRRRALLLFAAVVAPHVLFRIAYYGDLLPNTFYAKTGGGSAVWARGVRYIGDWLARYGAGGVALLALAGAASRRAAAPLALLAVFVVYVVAVGGDGLAMFRFTLFLSAPLALLAAEGSAGIARRLGRGGALLAPALLALALALPARNAFAGPYHRFAIDDRARVDLHWVQIGKWLARHSTPGKETVAVPVAGAIAYYGGLTTIDMLGITDRRIARKKMPSFGSGIAGHEKHDMDYVLSRKPTFFIHYPFLIPQPAFTKAQFETGWNPGLAALVESPAFAAEYRQEIAEVRIPGAQRLSYFAFFRRRGGFRSDDPAPIAVPLPPAGGDGEAR
jgi:hypothetical protein